LIKKLFSLKVLAVVVLLLVGAAIGAYFGGLAYARSRIQDELDAKAAAYGWTLQIAQIDVNWSGDIVLDGLVATGPLGGRVAIKRLQTQLSPQQFLDGVRRPEALDLYDVEVFLSRADVEDVARRRRERASDAAGEGGPTPRVRLHGGSVALATETDLGVVRLSDLEGELFREETLWTTTGRGILELDEPYPVAFSLDAKPSARWGHAQLNFAVPVEVHHELGDASVARLDVSGSPEAVAGSVFGLTLTPKTRFGVSRLAIEEVDFSIAKQVGEKSPGTWEIASLRANRPEARIRLDELLVGPIGRRYPVLLDVANLIGARFFDAPPITLEKAPPPPKEKTPAPTAPKESNLKSLLAHLPGVLVESGVVVVEMWGREVKLDGIDFDTTSMQSGDGTKYAFGVGLRGARAELVVEMASDSEWPAGSVSITALAAKDVFGLLGLKPPAQLEGALDFDLAITRSARGTLAVSGGVALHEVGFFHPKISERPLSGFNAELDFSLDYDHAAEHLVVDRLEVGIGPLKANATIDVKKVRSAPFIHFELDAKNLQCNLIPAAIPAGLLSTIDNLRFNDGTMSPHLVGDLPWTDPLKFNMKADGIPGDCEILSVGPHDVDATLTPEYTHTYLEYTSLAQGVTVGPGSGDYITLDELPGYVPAAMYLTEDRRFYDHGGLRIGLINRAIRLNIKERRYVYGGSTISQQLVKNLFLTRNKTLARKLEEVLIVWRLETVVPKDRILELYVNCIEFGPDVYGVVQAARFYFDKRAQDLEPLEAAFLASLKVAPVRGGKFYVRGFPKGGRWWNKRQKYILVALAQNGYLSPAEVLASYPWIPTFVYPREGADDFRTRWLERHRNDFTLRGDD